MEEPPLEPLAKIKSTCKPLRAVPFVNEKGAMKNAPCDDYDACFQVHFIGNAAMCQEGPGLPTSRSQHCVIVTLMRKKYKVNSNTYSVCADYSLSSVASWLSAAISVQNKGIQAGLL